VRKVWIEKFAGKDYPATYVEYSCGQRGEEEKCETEILNKEEEHEQLYGRCTCNHNHCVKFTAEEVALYSTNDEKIASHALLRNIPRYGPCDLLLIDIFEQRVLMSHGYCSYLVIFCLVTIGVRR